MQKKVQHQDVEDLHGLLQLPAVAAIVDEKIFCCHGGLSPELQQLTRSKRSSADGRAGHGPAKDLLWSDPDKDMVGWGENDRASRSRSARTSSRSSSARWTGPICGRTRSSRPYEFFARRQLVTIFSAPNYCGEFDNAGGMMAVDETLMLLPDPKAGRKSEAPALAASRSGRAAAGAQGALSSPPNNAAPARVKYGWGPICVYRSLRPLSTPTQGRSRPTRPAAALLGEEKPAAARRAGEKRRWRVRSGQRERRASVHTSSSHARFTTGAPLAGGAAAQTSASTCVAASGATTARRRAEPRREAGGLRRDGDARRAQDAQSGVTPCRERGVGVRASSTTASS